MATQKMKTKLQKKHLYISPLLCIMALASCHGRQGGDGTGAETGAVSADQLIGTWYINVDEGPLSGLERVTLDTLKFYIADALQYRGSDSGFDFTMNVGIDVEGTWTLRNDSLLFFYDKSSLQVTPNEESFEITMAKAGGNERNMNEVRAGMARELGETLTSGLLSQFENLDRAVPVYKGSPVRLVGDTLQLLYGDMLLQYFR